MYYFGPQTPLKTKDTGEPTTMTTYLEDYTNGTKIIHPDSAAKAARLFNSVRFEQPLSNFQETEIDKLWNAKP
jgi:hypothetical protein